MGGREGENTRMNIFRTCMFRNDGDPYFRLENRIRPYPLYPAIVFLRYTDEYLWPAIIFEHLLNVYIWIQTWREIKFAFSSSSSFSSSGRPLHRHRNWFMHTENNWIGFISTQLNISVSSHQPMPITGRFVIRLNACNSASFNLNLFVFCAACVQVALMFSLSFNLCVCVCVYGIAL